jgi:hypothetical protein
MLIRGIKTGNEVIRFKNLFFKIIFGVKFVRRKKKTENQK